jgi:hypothetical protein
MGFENRRRKTGRRRSHGRHRRNRIVLAGPATASRARPVNPASSGQGRAGVLPRQSSARAKNRPWSLVICRRSLLRPTAKPRIRRHRNRRSGKIQGRASRKGAEARRRRNNQLSRSNRPLRRKNGTRRSRPSVLPVKSASVVMKPIRAARGSRRLACWRRRVLRASAASRIVRSAVRSGAAHSTAQVAQQGVFIGRNRERIAKKFTTTPVFKDWEPPGGRSSVGPVFPQSPAV